MQSSRNKGFFKNKNPTQMSHLHANAPSDDKECERSRELTDKCMANDLAEDPSKNDLFQEPLLRQFRKMHFSLAPIL